MDDGNACTLEGGVAGAKSREDFMPGFAGEGEAAKYNRRSAPSSPPVLRWRALRPLVGGGVRGGEARKAEFNVKECVGRTSSSSSSEICPNGGEAGIVETSELKDRLGPWEFE